MRTPILDDKMPPVLIARELSTTEKTGVGYMYLLDMIRFYNMTFTGLGWKL